MVEGIDFRHYIAAFIKKMKYQDSYFPKDLFTQRGKIKAPTNR